MFERTPTFQKNMKQMSLGILGMGLFLSFLIEVNYGTDTCSFMNLGLSEHLGITFGTTMVMVNLLLFIPQVILNRKLIHVGTLMNMFLIGYISDFCRFLWDRFLPEAIFTLQPYRTITFVVALIPFLIAVALYMNANLGQVPYDAVPTIITQRTGLPFLVVRVTWDFLAILIGVLVGRHLTIGTVVLALTLGPTVTFIGKLMKAPHIKSDNILT